MRLFCLVLMGLTPTFPTLAPAQTVQREDLLGTWRGETDRGVKLKVLWRDGFWWGTHGGGRWRLRGDTLWLGDDWRYGYGGLGRRTGKPPAEAEAIDTLQMPRFMAYLANDPHYWTGTREERAALYQTLYRQKAAQLGDSVVHSPGDALSDAQYREEILNGFSSHIAVFKISLAGGKLMLTRLDRLSDPMPARVGYNNGPRETNGVYERTTCTVYWMRRPCD